MSERQLVAHRRPDSLQSAISYALFYCGRVGFRCLELTAVDRQLLWQDINANMVFFESSDRQDDGPLAQEWNELLKHGRLHWV
jgi:hypothetical protein